MSDHLFVGKFIEVGIGLAIAVGFAFVGLRLCRTDLLPDGRTRILIGTILFGTIAMTLAALLISVRSLDGTVIAEVEFSLFIAWSFGASLGSLITFYYERVRFQHQRLELSMEQTERLYRQLSLNQRVLRHNLRNDLNVIMGVADRLLEGKHSKSLTESLETINNVADRLLDTSETSLSMQQVLERDERQRFDLASVTRRIFDEFDARYTPVEFDTGSLESNIVSAHPKLPEAIRELVGNAIEHNATHGLVVATSTEQFSNGGEFVRLVIADTGAGLPPEERQAIEGRPETQLNHASGLGLWFVRAVVEQSGGTIDADDNDSQGTRFIIDLPRRSDKSHR